MSSSTANRSCRPRYTRRDGYRDGVRRKLRLLPVLVSGSFFVFLLFVYRFANEMQKETVSKTLISTANGVSWVELYPDWFFQLLVLLMLVALAGLSVSVASYLDSSFEEHKPQLVRLGLDFLVLMYLLVMFAYAIYDILIQGPIRVVWFPFVNASAYTVTVLIYSVVGLWLFRRFGWKTIIPLGLIGVFQEATWNFGYVSLYPNFPRSEYLPAWLTYTLVIVTATPVLLFLQHKWFRMRFSLNPWVFVFPLYYAFYYFLGMPTASSLPGTAHTNSLIFEGLYVLSCVVFYLAGFRLEQRVKNAAAPASTSSLPQTLTPQK